MARPGRRVTWLDMLSMGLSGQDERGLRSNQGVLEGQVGKEALGCDQRGRWLARVSLPAGWGMDHEEGQAEGKRTR